MTIGTGIEFQMLVQIQAKDHAGSDPYLGLVSENPSQRRLMPVMDPRSREAAFAQTGTTVCIG